MARKSFAEKRAEAEAVRFIHAIDKERRREAPRTLAVVMSSRPLDEMRVPKATNLGARHKRESTRKWTYVLTVRERCLVRWAERVHGGRVGREAVSLPTTHVLRWLGEARSRAYAAQGEADALDVALKHLRTGSRARLRKSLSGVRAQRVVKLTPVRDLTPVFDAAAWSREYVLAHSVEALALYGKEE